MEEWEKTFKEEITFNEKLIFMNPKSYAIFNHRCWLMLNLVPDSMKKTWIEELAFTKRMLDVDERNFHTWDYRRWLLKHWPIDLVNLKPSWDEELTFSKDLISKNMSNYSAWHYRSKLLQLKKDQGDWENEFELSNNAIFTDPNDQSAWWYYNSLIELVTGDSWLVSKERMQQEINTLRDLLELEPKNKHVNLALARIKRLVEPNVNVDELVSLYSTVCQLDPMRKNYYDDMSMFNFCINCTVSLMFFFQLLESFSIVNARLSLVDPSSTSLDLSNLDLTGIPTLNIIAKLPNLVSLDLSKNSIRHIDRNISKCLNLKVLNLNQNCIDNVGFLKNLVNLETLCLAGNSLTSSEALRTNFLDLSKECPKLSSIVLSGNDKLFDLIEELEKIFGSNCKIIY